VTRNWINQLIFASPNKAMRKSAATRQVDYIEQKLPFIATINTILTITELHV